MESRNESSRPSPEGASGEKPNIVLILTDDLGYGDVRCYHPGSLVPTPSIDRLAAEGMSFMNAHTSSSVCTPTRYSLLTGRYCWRTRLKEAVLFYYEQPLIEQGRMTIGSLLKQAGYHTGYVGKWHLGLDWATLDGNPVYPPEHIPGSKAQDASCEKRIDFDKPIAGGPADLGFDYFFGTSDCSTCQPPYAFIENRQFYQKPTEYRGGDCIRPGMMASDWNDADVDVHFAEKSREFLDNHKESQPDTPFFLTLATSAVHVPFTPPAFIKEKTTDYGRMICTVDWVVNQVMEALEAHGYAENTMIIFTSDNGPITTESAGRYRGTKWRIYDGGFRVPFIVRWPGKVIPGTVSQQTLCLTDMLATFAALTQQPLPQDAGEDSFDMLPAFLDPELESPIRNLTIHQSVDGTYTLKSGDWKIIFGDTDGRISDREHRLYNVVTGNAGQLFNIAADPEETCDVWSEYPEVVARLTREFEGHRASTGTALTERGRQ